MGGFYKSRLLKLFRAHSLVNLHCLDSEYSERNGTNIIVDDDLKKIDRKSRRKGDFEHVILSYENNRLVWFPEFFIDNFKELPTYHRHLTLLSIQTEILLKILKEYKRINPPSPKQDYLARRALVLLKVLSSSRTTFQSWNTVVRIKQNGNLIKNVHKKIYGDEFCIDWLVP